MNKIFLKCIPLVVLLSVLSSPFVSAQDDFDVLLEAGLNDANKLIEGYVNPFMKGFGTGLSNGWYNTAAVHKPAGFDLTITVNAAYVPDDDLFYNVNDLGLETVELQDAAYPDGNVPTFFGPSDGSPTYVDQATGTQFIEGPEGLGLEDEIGFNAVPVPMAQLGIGLIKNTDLKIRWTPEIDIDDGSGTFKLIGFGVMHDVKQHIPGIKMLPFDLSAFVGYTNMETVVDLAENAGETQTGEFKVRTLTIQGLISKKFSVLTLYGGLGFNRVRSDLDMLGEYDINEDGDFSDPGEVNPISMDFKAGGPRLTAGFRLKLAVLTLHADYTLQEYKTLTVGFGFSFREK